MSAYVLSEVEILDETVADRYRSIAAASIAQYGGRYLVRGGGIDVVEGEWPSNKRVVIVEFPTMERARAWYASAEYAEALELRHMALNRRLIFIEGVPAPSGTAAPNATASARDAVDAQCESISPKGESR